MLGSPGDFAARQYQWIMFLRVYDTDKARTQAFRTGNCPLLTGQGKAFTWLRALPVPQGVKRPAWNGGLGGVALWPAQSGDGGTGGE